MWKCFICGHETVIWDSDFDTQALGIEEEGIVYYFHCSECGVSYEAVKIFENKEE